MNQERIGPMLAFREGCRILIKHAPVLLGGMLICACVFTLCVKASWPGWVILLGVTFPLLGGLQTLFLKAARDTEPRLTDVFSGFRRCWTWFGVGWALFGIWLLFTLPVSFLVLGILMLLLYDPLQMNKAAEGHFVWWIPHISGAAVGGLVGLATFTGYLFTWMATADGASYRVSDIRSHQLVRDKRLSLFLTVLSLGLIGPVGLGALGLVVRATNGNAYGWPGWVIYGAGVFVSAALALCALTSTYLRLDSPQEREAASASSPVSAPPPVVFVGEPEIIQPAQAFLEGWKTCVKHPFLAFFSASLCWMVGLLGALIWMGCVTLISNNPLLVFALIPLTAPYMILIVPVMGGALSSFVSLARGRNRGLSSLSFARESTKWSVAGWATFAAAVILSLPYTLAVWPHSCSLTLPWFASGPMTALIALASLALAAVGATGWPYGCFALAETRGLGQALNLYSKAFRRSTAPAAFCSLLLSACGPLSLFALGWVIYRANANAFGIPGWIALGIGIVFSSAVGLASMAALYVHLVPVASEPVTDEKAA